MKFELENMPTPALIRDSELAKFGDKFTIYAELRADIIGGKQTIFSKRTPVSEGNRPGVNLILEGSWITLMTFESG